MKSVRSIAIVCITTIAIMALILGTLLMPSNIDKQSEANFQVDYTPREVTTETENSVIETPKTNSICLIDQSGSMSDYTNKYFFAAGYDTIRTFGTEDSRITTEVVNAIDNGYQRIGVVTDLESWPSEEIEAIAGRSIGNVEIVFFVPEHVIGDANYNIYVDHYVDAMNSSNSTLRFVELETQTVISVFENYKQLVEVPANTSITPADSSFTATGNYVEGNKIPYSLVLILILVFFLIIMALIIALIALAGAFGKKKDKDTGTVPAGVQRAIHANAVALDGSSSVSNIYSQFINWCRQESVSNVFRFASQVEELSLDEAENKAASGQTVGYTCLKELFDRGYKEITIVSDMEFNDSPIDGIKFNKIFFVGSNLTEDKIDHLKSFCNDYEIISI